MSKIILTAEEALSLVIEGENVHTFRNPNGSMLMGCDISRTRLVELINQSDQVELGGEMCRKMKHGLVVWTGDDPLFVETDMVKLDAFDPQNITE